MLTIWSSPDCHGHSPGFGEPDHSSLLEDLAESYGLAAKSSALAKWGAVYVTLSV